MILPDISLVNFANLNWEYTGIDSKESCLNLQHFLDYPHHITYQYNSRGFRDDEWPNDPQELKKAIWCVGDSFTVGLGTPVQSIWPCVLQQVADRRTINVSMNGASNNWIARKAVKILQEISPANMIIHWSYVHRREQDENIILDQSWQNFYSQIREPGWPNCTRHDRHKLPKFIIDKIDHDHGGWIEPGIHDDKRMLQHIACSDEDDIQNTLTCIDLVNQAAVDNKVIHSFIPNFAPEKFKGVIESRVSTLVIPEFKILDLARDGHHYDVLTSRYFVNQIMSLLN
jgi:hypothetical protein